MLFQATERYPNDNGIKWSEEQLVTLVRAVPVKWDFKKCQKFVVRQIGSMLISDHLFKKFSDKRKIEKWLIIVQNMVWSMLVFLSCGLIMANSKAQV